MAANHRRPITKSLLPLLLLPYISSLPASSQPLPPPLLTPATDNLASPASTVSPALSIFIVAFIGVFILLIFFFIYLRFCVGRRPTVTPAAPALSLNEPRNRGLDSALLASFPTMVYSDVKGRKLGKHPLECAVCLCEFGGGDILRLIPSCSHVFHRDCIDVWLDCHVTCPVCRRNLTSHSSAAAAVDREIELADLVRIGSERRGANLGSVSRGDWEERVAAGGGREERFRLRLPEDVRKNFGRSASLGVSPAGREKDGGFLFWRSLRLSSARERDLDGKSRVRSDGGDDSKEACSQV